MESLISIIVPAYNVEPYLERCVISLINQSYEKIEILLVNDGSTDGTGELCNRLAEKDSRIKVFHQKNKGLSGARNKGIYFAQGEYITFIDSDDYVSNDYIRILYEVALKNTADMVFCDFLEMKEGDTLEENKEVVYHEKIYDKTELYDIISDIVHHEKTKVVIACAKLFKRGIFESFRFPEGRIHEDEFSVHHLLWKCKKVVGIDSSLYYYCIRSGSITGDEEYNDRHLQVLDAYEDRVQFYKEHLSKELFVAMIICFFEMITVEYQRALKQHAEADICEHIRKIMNRKIGRYGKYISFRKRAKYLLFVFAPNRYFRHFWKE